MSHLMGHMGRGSNVTGTTIGTALVLTLQLTPLVRGPYTPHPILLDALLLACIVAQECHYTWLEAQPRDSIMM